jgi:hypothetical protein
MVRRWPDGVSQTIEERYTCEPTGAISVEIQNLSAGHSRQYRLGHWSGDSNAKPTKKAAVKR